MMRNSDNGGDEDGWAYWSRVYSDSKLRTEVEEAGNAQGYSTVTEVLSEKTLERTKIVIENLPKSCTEEEIRNLLEGELGSPKVMKVLFPGRNSKDHKATVEFYVAADAYEAVDRFHGFQFRGNFLRVWNAAQPLVATTPSQSFSASVSCSDDKEIDLDPPPPPPSQLPRNAPSGVPVVKGLHSLRNVCPI